MLIAVLFVYWVCGADINFIPYISAEPSLPYSVTIKGKTISLLSGEANLNNALNGYYDRISPSAWDYVGAGVLVSCNYGKYTEYWLDAFGLDKSSIYNGVTAASTKEELEAAFGTDCIKTDEYYAEIFIDDKEVDYSQKQDYPADFYGYNFDFDDWFEYIKMKYPDTETITVIICWYYDYVPNNIEFYIYPEIT